MNGTDIKPLIHIWFWSAKGIGYCYRWCCYHKKRRKISIHTNVFVNIVPWYIIRCVYMRMYSFLILCCAVLNIFLYRHKVRLGLHNRWYYTLLRDTTIQMCFLFRSASWLCNLSQRINKDVDKNIVMIIYILI